MSIEIITKICAEQLGLPEADIAPDAPLETLGMDSLDIVEVVMEIEDRLKLRGLDDAHLRVATATVNDLVKLAETGRRLTP